MRVTLLRAQTSTDVRPPLPLPLVAGDLPFTGCHGGEAGPANLALRSAGAVRRQVEGTTATEGLLGTRRTAETCLGATRDLVTGDLWTIADVGLLPRDNTWNGTEAREHGSFLATGEGVGIFANLML